MVMVACSSPSDPDSTPTSSEDTIVNTSIESFLTDYVSADGRVLRHDQGDDIVSEGQAYGMLIAETAGRADAARTIWGWTKAHLARPDGLLAYHASANGEVLDDASATDADTLAAFALLRYDGEGASSMHADGRNLADAVLSHETATDDAGRLVPVAGSWAVGPPMVVNPSYWMPAVFDELARLTGDDRWGDLALTTIDLVAKATQDGRSLPTDWGHVSGSELEPVAAPDGSADVQYGLDAQRVPIWFATSCSQQAHSLAAAWWELLSSDDRSSALALAPDGNVVDDQSNPVPLLAAAAAARAAGDGSRSATLVAQAAAQAKATPTYYGDAWLALYSGLDQGSLVGCPADG
jgi:endoglucanase